MTELHSKAVNSKYWQGYTPEAMQTDSWEDMGRVYKTLWIITITAHAIMFYLLLHLV